MGRITAGKVAARGGSAGALYRRREGSAAGGGECSREGSTGAQEEGGEYRGGRRVQAAGERTAVVGKLKGGLEGHLLVVVEFLLDQRTIVQRLHVRAPVHARDALRLPVVRSWIHPQAHNAIKMVQLLFSAIYLHF